MIKINLLTVEVNEQEITMTPDEGRSLQLALSHFYSNEHGDEQAPINYPPYSWSVVGGEGRVSV